ncbi:unnamed protein product [Acanthoscelides obtectus]|uniref:Acyl-CoA synthetase family member 3, mitochondrial n=1 Tax=Acanthoscelides obtectus TaxID=200917 RepID=A0A9P0LG93_ACAOB|nr:unnamed protein product [Acanthoscelides obtectus]CAK1650091.1 Acyl-CoA synthetase family member 3, mitochondrial [Acanthoscelides obtectus]
MLRKVSRLSLIKVSIRKFSESRQVTPLYEHANTFKNTVAIYDQNGEQTFGSIYDKAKNLSNEIVKILGRGNNERILFLCPNDANYVFVLWGIWMAGHTAVPLSHLHPENILHYYAKDTNSKLFIATPEHETLMKRIAEQNKVTLHIVGHESNVTNHEQTLHKFDENDNAFILYTSGTTGNPKGVVHTNKNVWVQTKTLVNAWKWSSEDIMLHTLPLHHVHGTVCALFSPLLIGASTVMIPRFSPGVIWDHLLGRQGQKITVFMAVPTIYAKLIEEFEKNCKNDKEYIRSYMKNNVRLMVSGSAPLPIPLYQKWYEITGHKLLEREPGYVGVPLPGVAIHLADSNKNHKTLLECYNDGNKLNFDKSINEDVKGNLLVKGTNVFKEYYNKPEATKKEFTEDGWFITGDACEYSHEKRRFRILGRTSVDIIKSGGYKISALQIETKLLAHPDIKDIAVVGVKDDTWGEKIAALVVLEENSKMTLEDLRRWAGEYMPKYSLPSILKIVNEIPKNIMGKVNKKQLVEDLFHT